jgi:hypothetical protein
MGLLDDATSKLDALTAAGETSKAKGEPKFYLKEILSKDDAGSSGFVGPSHSGQTDKPNTLKPGIPIEFIHFGNVHPGTGKKFPHSNFDPEQATAPPDGHAIMFRDAVEREAIALFGMVSSTRVTLKEATESKGALEDVANLASNALGGGSSAAKPDPTQLDTFLDEIKSQIDTINKPAILYPEIHEAGKKLNETRATYIAFCKSLNDFYIKPPEGNPLDAAAGAIANVPGVGNIMATVQRFAFKMQDLYLAAYLNLRLTHEKSVEEGAHALTVEAIKKNYKDFPYTFPIWFIQSESQKPKPGGGNDDDDGGSNLPDLIQEKVDEAKKKVDDAKKKVDDVKDDIGKKVDKVYDFLGMNGEPEKTPGTAALKKIFGDLKGPVQTVTGAKPSASTCIIEGMSAAMKDILDDGIPDFIKKVMTKINDSNIGLLEEVFARIMASGAAGKIESQYLVEAGRRHLSKRIVSIMADLIGGVLPGGGNFTMGMPGGKTLDAQQFIAHIIETKLIHYVDPIIEFCIGDLAGQMEASRLKAEENKAQTMEVLLGRLPWLTALMFRNTFFPIWNLVIEKVFEQIMPEVAKVVAVVNGVFETAKNAVDQANDYKNRAGAVQQQMASGVDSVGDIQNLGNAVSNESPEAKARREQREREQAEKDRLDAFYVENDKDDKFPVLTRVLNGEGNKVEERVPGVPTVEEGAVPPQQPAGEQPPSNEQSNTNPPGLPAGMP